MFWRGLITTETLPGDRPNLPDPIARLNAALEGRYAIERELGEGGMATVYLADDIKHERRVALKVLKPELAAVVGAERFLAEIKTTANLTHPHILPLHDSGEADSFVFYVMPYVEGESLRDRLDREHQLPVDEAVKITTDLAEAIDYAHRNDVIHRDIKPANILMHEGRPLIADFGIALAVGAAGGGRMTETGLSLGTPFYMSPEQATGDQFVGPATDTYALGAVLYEMLTGDPPYMGSTAQAVLGQIIAGDAVTAIKKRPSVPANVDAALRCALDKLPADRFTSAQNFASALADEHFRYGELAAAGAGASAGPWNRLSKGLAGLATLLAVTVIVTSRPVAQPTPEVVRFSVPIAQDDNVILGGIRDAAFGRPSSTSLAISPDGDLLVYSARDGAGTPEADSRLYSRRLDQARAEPITGTEGGSSPFFSPDGDWIGFIAGSSLKRVSVVDGTTETIVPEAPFGGIQPFGATWGDDGTIVFGGVFSLYQVAAIGGEPEMLAEAVVSGEVVVYAQPHMLPGSRTVLVTVAGQGGPETAEIVAFDIATGDQKTLLSDAMDARYVQTGHLLFMRQGVLMAVGFDVERLEIAGQPVTILDDVMQALFMPRNDYETGAGQVAVSASGHLAYALGGVYPERPSRVSRITSTGDTTSLDMDPRLYLQFRLSPDGTRLAAVSRQGQRDEIWVHDLVRGVSQRLNTGGSTSWPLAWSPDGQWLAFSSPRGGTLANLYRLPADGSGEPERLAPSDRWQIMSSWSSQGVIAWLAADSLGGDIWVLPPDGSPEPFFASEAGEAYPTFSPDGNWLAYTSDQSGRQEVYVRPYPGPEPATQISGDGGRDVAWSPDGRQIYYFQPGGALMAVDVTPGDEFQAGRPAPLIDPWTFFVTPVRGYDVFPDGSFVIAVPDDDRGYLEQHGVTEFHVILNFLEELKERVGN
jgi:eukaryotic-like serine/threonine-protein kinase